MGIHLLCPVFTLLSCVAASCLPFLITFFVCVKHTRFLIEYQPFFHAFTLSSRLAVHSVSASSSLFSFSL